VILKHVTVRLDRIAEHSVGEIGGFDPGRVFPGFVLTGRIWKLEPVAFRVWGVDKLNLLDECQELLRNGQRVRLPRVRSHAAPPLLNIYRNRCIRRVSGQCGRGGGLRRHPHDGRHTWAVRLDLQSGHLQPGFSGGQRAQELFGPGYSEEGTCHVAAHMPLIEMLDAAPRLKRQWLRKEIWSDSAMSSASTARSPSPSRSRACRRSLSELVAGLCAAVRSGSAPCSSMRCA